MNEKNETCPHEDARNLKAMIDVLQMASTTDGLLDDTLEDYAGSMLEKVNVICNWFNAGGVERITSGSRDEAATEPKASGNRTAAERLESTADRKLSIGDRLDKLAGEAESDASVSGIIANSIAGDSGEGALYMCEREFYRIQETLNDIWSDWEREKKAAGGAA